MEKTLQAIVYKSGRYPSLEILDQLKLPYQTVYVPIKTTSDAFDAIKRMVVRGAPAIAIVAALSLAVQVSRQEYSSAEEARKDIESKLDHLVSARPTAVNLSQAAGILKQVSASSSSPVEDVVKRAEQMLEDDIKDNKAIGDHGSKWIRDQLNLKDGEKFSALTICNTGSLATAGYGTALGIIRSLHEQGVLSHAYCLETRPYNQGSRLTAYELVYDGIPATLITDSMAAALLRQHPEIKLVVVGADRVAKNGDTANKIGTYQLSILAKQFPHVKFVVAAPTTSIDQNTASGDAIVIEERPHRELVQITGPVLNGTEVDLDRVETLVTAADGIGIWNPAFDVTPIDNIDAIVTEKGLYQPS
uniref:Methylthioribose-1-phosphate isomerase n=1 Tax=Blastobotrys adeninivorans TaxID=409370 RepID=A0A060T545_BLAAD